MSAANWIDVLGGLAQLTFALYLLRVRRGPAVGTFAAFLGLNGLAFLLGNLVSRAHPLYSLLRLTSWGILNWFALFAVVAACIYISRAAKRRVLALTAAALAALPLLVLAWTSAPNSVTIVVFGGSAVYSGVAALLVLSLGLARNRSISELGTALFVAMAGINSGLHAGVGLIARTSPYNVVHAALITCVALLWSLSRVDFRARFTAMGSLLLSLAVGVAAMSVLNTQAAVQDSGIYGLGRIMAVLIGAIAVQRRLFFEHLGPFEPRAVELRRAMPAPSRHT